MADSLVAEAQAEVLLFSKRMLADQLVYYTAGNISVRVPGHIDRIALTPRDTAYDTMVADDIVITDSWGSVIESNGRLPTSEAPMHLGIYRARPDVLGVVHTHSPAAMAMATIGDRLPAILTGLVSAAGGDIHVAPYARSASNEMDEFTLPLLEERSVCFLRNHGLLAIGSTLEQAYNAAAVTEGAADAYLRARPYSPLELPGEEIERIRNKWIRRWPDRVSAVDQGA